MKKIIHYLVALLLLSIGSTSFGNNGLDACTDLQDPFTTLAQLVLDPAVPNPPQVQLCHRTANAAKHYEQERATKAVDELEKFIAEVEQSTPTHIMQTQADTLTAEAELVIQIITGGVSVGKVSGGVYYFGTKDPVPSAAVTVTFSETATVYSVVSDTNGLFSIENVEPEGAFVVTAEDGGGATGSAQGSILEADLEPSVVVFIDQPGSGSIQGQVLFESGTPAGNALVTATFPETERVYTTLTGIDGTYTLSQLHFDGTVILIGFDSESGASASFSSVVSANFPSPTVNLVLTTPPVVNPELLNAGFTDGLNGWYSSGPVQIVDRDLYFGSQGN